VLPLFTELRPYIEDLFSLNNDGDVYLITRYRDLNANLRTQLGRIARKAGVPFWGKPFMNKRASRSTELSERFPSHVGAEWLGHSEKIANDHYRQVTNHHFDAAIIDIKSDVTTVGNDRNTRKRY
jgi:hypothetical protein